MEADFSGYATKAGLKCSDGRTILSGAFKHQNNTTVPLVWQHGHNDPDNVLGHAVLEERPDGVYAKCYFNSTPKAVTAKQLVQHKDITMMSIYANNLVQKSNQVVHGNIREVSLVISGANPGALIDNVMVRHADGDTTVIDEEAVITTGVPVELEHSDDDDDDDLEHATVQEVYDTLNDDQKNLLHFMLQKAIEEGGGEAKQDALGDGTTDDKTKTDDDKKEGSAVTHNAFEGAGGGAGTKTAERTVISHDGLLEIKASFEKGGSLKHAVEEYALKHGIDNIESLFPEAQLVRPGAPEWITRRMEWVADVLQGVHKPPFAKIKSRTADLTMDEARAKGYIKGNMKKEQFFTLAQRETGPQTIYKKQKFDRDDIIDITDFDLIAWVKGEMRVMLDEELARAILLGDGREVDDEDKIREDKIRPIVSDDDFYTVKVFVNLNDANSSFQEVIDEFTRNRYRYKGSGNPVMFTTEQWIAEALLLKDTLGRDLYPSVDALATKLRVRRIIPVEVMEDYPDVIAIVVNLIDYSLGTNRGGQVTFFDDFDIDFNQYKYLIETRVSGALTRPRSAMVYTKVAGTDVLAVPLEPEFDPETGEYTITDVTGVVYKDGAGVVVNAAGSPYTIAPGESDTITATPATGYYFRTNQDDEWTFQAEG